MVNLGELVFSIIAEDKASTTVGAAAAKIGQSMAVAGAAITAFGAGATLLIDRNREMDASFRTTALSAGLPAESIKELARSLQSVDSPIAEVSATLDILARSGMDNVESMGQTASAFDTLADGIGVNADTLTDAMVPAFAALNIELEDAPQYVDGLATTFRTANVDLDDFTRMMERVGPELGEMGLGLQDVEAILMALAEKGITGRTAIRELNEAIEESGGSSAALYRSLGITNTELGTYNTKLANSAGAAQEFADAQNSAFGTVDKLGFELDKLGQSAGDMLAPFEGVATACIAVGPAMTAAGSAASLLDSEMMVKLFPSLGKVVTGITGAGGLVPALGTFTTSLGLTTAGMSSFAIAAAAIAVPLVALVGTCALLGPAIDTAAQAWAGFLGATKDTTAAIEGVEEQYDITTGAVIRYADEQEKAAIIAADASLQYDGITGAIIENADAIAVAEQQYDEFGNAITDTNDAVAGSVIIYDEMGQIVGEMVPAIEGADTAAGNAAVSFDEWGNAIADIPGQIVETADAVEAINPELDEQNSLLEEAARRFGTASKEADGYASSLSTLEIAQRTWNGTQATSFEYYKQGLEAGAPPSPADYASPEGYMDALKEWQGKVSGGDAKKPGSPASSGSGSGSPEPTWQGKGDPDYTGGDPDAWKNDPRIQQATESTRAYVETVKTVAPATAGATTSIRESAKAYGDVKTSADPVGPALATIGTAAGTSGSQTAAAAAQVADMKAELERVATACGTTSPQYIALATQAASLGIVSLSTVDGLRQQATATQAAGTTAGAATPAFSGLGQVLYDASGAAYTLQAPVGQLTPTISGAAQAATVMAPAVTGAGTAMTGAGGAADIASKKIDAAKLAYDDAQRAADIAAQKVQVSKLAFDAAAGAANANAAQVEAARRAYDNAKTAAAEAAMKVDASRQALDLAKKAAAEATGTINNTAGALNSVGTSAATAAGKFVAMGKEYLTARNSIQSNPITSIQVIRRIVEEGGANVAPGPSATKYYPKFHEGGTYEAPAGQSEGFAKLLDGERVLSRAETREYEGGGIAAAVAAGIAKGLSAIGLGSGGGDVIVHGDVKLSEDYSYDRFREDVGRWKSSRIAKGVLS